MGFVLWSFTVALCASPTTAVAGEGEPTSAVSVDQANWKQKQGAQKAFVQAMRHFQAGRHKEALSGFKASHDIVASPNSRLMIARTLDALGRTYEAFFEAEAAVEEGEALVRKGPAFQKYAQAVDAAKKEMEQLRAKLSVVTVYVSPIPPPPPPDPDDPEAEPRERVEPKLTVSGREIPSEQWGKPIPVQPGTHRVVLVTYLGTEDRVVTVEPGKQATVTIGHETFEEKPAEPQKPVAVVEEDKPLFSGGDPSLRVPSYIVGGIGVTGLLVAAILGGVSNSKYSDLEDSCDEDNLCPAGLEDDRDSGRGLQAAANVSAIVGAIGLTAGAALFVLGHVDMFEPGEEAASSGVPKVSVGLGSVSIQGRF